MVRFAGIGAVAAAIGIILAGLGDLRPNALILGWLAIGSLHYAMWQPGKRGQAWRSRASAASRHIYAIMPGRCRT